MTIPVCLIGQVSSNIFFFSILLPCYDVVLGYTTSMESVFSSILLVYFYFFKIIKLKSLILRYNNEQWLNSIWYLIVFLYICYINIICNWGWSYLFFFRAIKIFLTDPYAYILQISLLLFSNVWAYTCLHIYVRWYIEYFV